MSWTKLQLIEMAVKLLGLGKFQHDYQAEEIQVAAYQLDAMLANWSLRGIDLSFPVPTSPENTDKDDETNIPDWAAAAVYQNLAIRIAPAYGRNVMASLKQAAFLSFNELLNRAAIPDNMQFPPTFPRGAGNKPKRYFETYFGEPVTLQPWDEK